MSDTQKQIIELVFEKSRATADSQKWNQDEQRRTRETAAVAAKAAKDAAAASRAADAQLRQSKRQWRQEDAEALREFTRRDAEENRRRVKAASDAAREIAAASRAAEREIAESKQQAQRSAAKAVGESIAAQVKDSTEAVKRAAKDQVDATIDSLKDQIAAARRAQQDRDLIAKQAFDREVQLDRERLEQKTQAFRREQDELERVENQRHAEARIATRNAIEQQARDFEAGQRRQQAAFDQTRQKGAASIQHIIDKMNAEKAATAEAAKEAENLGGSLTKLVASQAILSTLHRVTQAISSSMNDAAEFVQRVTRDFIETQKAMQSIAALTGHVNTDKYTIEQAKKAGAANLTPREMAGFQDEFLSRASAYIGDAPDSIMSEAEADKFQASLAEYGKLHGVAPSEMAGFAGDLLSGQKGPTTAAEMTSRAGKIFATLEASSKRVGLLLPRMTRVMAQGGFSPEEAAPVLAMMPKIAPNEEDTYLLSAVSEIRKLDMAGRGSEYGLSDGMTPAQQLQAVVANLYGRSNGGADAKTLNKLIAGVTKEREAGGALRGMVAQGPAGFAKWRDILEKTPDDAVAADIVAGRGEAAGRTMHAESRLAVAEAIQGARYADVDRIRKEARAQLTEEGRFTEYHPIEDSLRFATSNLGGAAAQEQIVNERSVDLAYEKARIPLANRESLPLGAQQAAANDAIRRILERGVELQEEQLRIARQQGAGIPGAPTTLPPALPALPLAGPGRGP